MSELFLPTLHTFAMDNIFTGSVGEFRFRIQPKIVKKDNKKEVDMDASTMEAEFWHGLYCYEKSEMEGKASFPLSEAGREELLSWLKSNI